MSKVRVIPVNLADFQWGDKELVVKASDYDQLKAENRDLFLHFDTLKADYDQQAARIAELQLDADRYRWLRERGDAFQWENILRFYLDECNYADNAQALDAAIDAAMEGSKGE